MDEINIENQPVVVVDNIDKKPKPNAFVFKALIDDQYRICVCPRINDAWSEADIVYLPGGFPAMEGLEEKLFHVVYVYMQKDAEGEGFTIKHSNSYYLKSDTKIAQELYQQKLFFSTVEEGYQMFYGDKSTDKQ